MGYYRDVIVLDEHPGFINLYNEEMKIMSNDNKELKTEEICNGIKNLTEEDLDNVTGGKGPTSVPSVSLFPPSSEELSANKA